MDTNELSQEFLEAAKPLIKFLARKVPPHHTVVVTSTGAELLEGSISTGQVTEFLVDREQLN
jgi:hypothetical protein